VEEKGLMEDIAEIIQQFGFPILAMLGLGYFVYFVWTTITEKIDPATEDMKMTVLKLIDQIRLMDNDMIRLQKKLDTVLQMKENERKNNNSTPIRRESDSRRDNS
tara:strand:- start:194 stop:508 length:315 start_codon:yes stop_codon:yes gene_type:complete